MAIYPDSQLTVLRLLAECGLVSKKALNLAPYSYYHCTKKLKELLDSGHIRKTGKGGGKCYALTPSGRNILSETNEYRFTTELFELNMLLTRHSDRAMLRGDVAAALSLAGYCVHPDDKPTLPAYCPPFSLTPDDTVKRNGRYYSNVAAGIHESRRRCAEFGTARRQHLHRAHNQIFR